MERQELLIRIDELEKQILELPAGSIAKKKVRGKDYYYHRWFEGKKRVEKIQDSQNTAGKRCGRIAGRLFTLG